MSNQVDKAITSIKLERDALKTRLDALDEALVLLAPWEPRPGEKIAPRANLSVREASSAGPVVQTKKLRRLAITRWRQKLRDGESIYSTHKRRKLHHRVCVQCGKGFLGVHSGGRFHNKKCADNYYTRHYRLTGARVGKNTHPTYQSKAKPESELFHYRVINGVRRKYTYHTTPEQRKAIARRAGMAARQAYIVRKRQQVKAALKGVTLLPGDPIIANEVK